MKYFLELNSDQFPACVGVEPRRCQEDLYSKHLELSAVLLAGLSLARVGADPQDWPLIGRPAGS